MYCTRILAIALLLAGSAYAESVFIDLVDSSDPITQPPPGIVVVDVAVETAPDLWVAAALRGQTAAGVRLVYAEARDPNNPDEIYTRPGADQRFVTFFSNVYRESNRDTRWRYESPFCDAILAGQYCASAQSPEVFSGSEVDVGWFAEFGNRAPACWDNPPPPTFIWIMRIALDVSAISELIDSDFVACRQTDAPDGFVPVFQTGCDREVYGTTSGFAIATYDRPMMRGFDWGIYVRLRSSHSLPGDLDGDCDVDLQDLATLLAHFGTPTGGGATYEQGDIFGDGGVDLSDLGALLGNFANRCP
jgi:hypothetical protein